ncbi:energy-coupling factor ABC transporter ATP-binding protein [Thalassobius sp. Cn5-15]|uniref:energy-coupling factor ABC transporter ATP-binding protein n=1 Tax=Thalassobius sp. Cn5-15 TaxID=2917763 RepID=UPI001EF23583|nr:ABC transporter ATP-binding protein [Thalassobius sp. Cn5-15]MCG7493541.1 energy-coupling factor ABC transporter ATP-binding protein [Thalassobius sp. Cn5-15]
MTSPQDGATLNAATDPAAAAAPTCRVELSNISYLRDGVEVFDGLNLSLNERRIGVIGRNGSGKSQLARLIAGLAPADAGKVTVNGVDVAKERLKALRTVGILFQNPDHQIIFPTVGEELTFGLVAQGMPKDDAQAKARRTLEGFNRLDWYDRSIQTLSQGQRHLVCLMAVLAMNPGVIVLDEPFAGLDLPTTLALSRYLDRVAPALIHISHDLDALRDYDRVIWIDQGKVKQDGAAAAVIDGYVAAMQGQGDGDDFADL